MSGYGNISTNISFGYAPISSLLEGWSNEWQSIKMNPTVNDVKTHLLTVYKKFSRVFHEANYYSINLSDYTNKWGPISGINTFNPIQNVCIVELNEKIEDETFPEDGIEIIKLSHWYIIYIDKSNKGLLDDEKFYILMGKLIGNIKDIISYDYLKPPARDSILDIKEFWEYGSYEIYRFIYPLYCVFNWIYSMKSNTDFYMWESIISDDFLDNYYLSHKVPISEKLTNIRNEYEGKIIGIVYDLLLYMSKNNLCYIEDICAAVMNSDLIQIMIDYDYITSSYLESVPDFSMKLYEERKVREIHLLILDELPVSENNEDEVEEEDGTNAESDKSNTNTEV